MSLNYESPTSGPGGDYDMHEVAEDAEDGVLDDVVVGMAHWEPQVWSRGPVSLENEARAMNKAGYAHAAAHATKHSNPPAPPSWMRDC